MQIIENLKVKEKIVIEKLDNGLTIIVAPKKNIMKKYIIWGVNYGSNDSEFKVDGNDEEVIVPNGVAHFLEHKLFEQKNGTNSLDTLTAIGVNANAYTTNDHTSYLFECTENFYEALDEFMDYVQNPYFTDENVEKEKGIIGQEIMMYDDSPDWRVYLNAIDAMYFNHPVKLDIAGTIETISHIDKEALYNCYNTFYNPANMVMVISGDFEPKEIIEEVKKRIIKKEKIGTIERKKIEEPEQVVKKEVKQKLEVSKPIYVIGIKDKRKDCNLEKNDEIVRKHIAIDILLNLILGSSSKLFKNLYQENILTGVPGMDYEFSKGYAHITISGQSIDPKKVFEMFKCEVEEVKKNGINEEDFNRIKKMIYGTFIKEYDDVANISRMFLADYFKGINSFNYLEEIQTVDIKYAKMILDEVFNLDKMVISIVDNN